MVRLHVVESPQEQASQEIIAWAFDWTVRLAGETVSSATATITQLDTNADVSATSIQGAVAVATPVTTVTVKALTARKVYRLSVAAVFSGGSTQVATLDIECPY
jgi:hypothetical protein